MLLYNRAREKQADKYLLSLENWWENDMMTNTIKIKSTPSFDSLTGSAPQERPHFTPSFMPAMAQELTEGNIVWALDGMTFVKVKIIAKIQSGYKVKNLIDDYEIKHGTIFSASQLFSKCD